MPLKSILLRIIIGFLILWVIVFGLLFLFKDKIIRQVVDQLEKSTQTEISYQSTGINFFNIFPNVKASINELSVVDKVSLDSLLTADKMAFYVNPVKLLTNKKNISVSRIDLTGPEIRYTIFAPNKTNWDGFLNSNQSSGPKEVQRSIHVKSIGVKDGNITYADQVNNQLLNLGDITYDGRITIDKNHLTHIGQAASILTYRSAQWMDLSGYKVTLDTEIQGDLKENKYQFSSTKLGINDLLLDFTGDIQYQTDSLVYDIDYSAAEQDFSSLLSLLQNVQNQKSQFDVKGKFSSKGKVKGTVGKENTFPMYNIQLKTDNAEVSSEANGMAKTECVIDATLINSSPDKIYEIIDVRRFNIIQGQDKITGSLKMNGQAKSSFIDFDLVVVIADLKHFDALTTYDLQSGKISIRSKGKFDLDDIERGDYAGIDFFLDGNIAGVSCMLDTTLLTVKKIAAKGDQMKIELSFDDIFYNLTDFTGLLQLQSPLQSLLPNKSINFNAKGRSRSIDLNQWLTSEKSTKKTQLPHLNGSFSWSADKVQYRAMVLGGLSFNGKLSNDQLIIEHLNGGIGASDFLVTGQINGINPYLNRTGLLTGTLDIDSKILKLDQLYDMYYDSSYVAPISDLAPFANMDIKIISSSKKLEYKKLMLSDNLATLNLTDNVFKINNITSKSFGGTLQMQGSFVLNPDDTGLDLKADFTNISIVQSLQSLPFFAKLAYPLSFIQGKVNTTFNLQSLLDDQYNLVLPRVNAFGLLETIEGNFVGFKPIEVLNNFLNITQAKDYAIKKSKNWVTVKDGWVQVDEFEFNIGANNFKVKGAHSLQNALNYQIIAVVPSELLSKINIKSKVGSEIFDKINKYRSVGKDKVGLYFTMKGTFDKPELKLNEVDMLTAGKAAFDEVVQTAKDTIKSTIDTLQNRIQDSIDIYVQKAEDKLDEAIDEAKDKIVKEAESKLDSAVFSQLDSLGGRILKDAGIDDSIKEKIFELKDIFKKKKSG